MTCPVSRFIHIFLFIVMAASAVFADDTASPDPDDTVNAPVFPGTPGRLIYIEGEQAVSTNFNREPTLNYSASSFRTLQLSSASRLYKDRSYFAEYVFFVPDDGEYDFWYAGSPAGPRDEVLPSFASPFEYRIDEAVPVAVFREDIEVVEEYADGLYWNRITSVALKKGVHRLRFEVSRQRRHDNRFHFSLDAFFFLADQPEDLDRDFLPLRFPADPDNRNIDNPFMSLSEYEKAIKARPEEPGLYLSAAKISTLMGDYLEALKYLNQARLLDPDNRKVLLLIAKNRLWRGDVKAGMAAYRQLLTRYPDDAAMWAEAGKVAAWAGEYRLSEGFYLDGLARFENELNLIVNLGLLYLWSSRPAEAGDFLEKARLLAMERPGLVLELGTVLRANGYNEKAVPVYEDAQKKFPAYVDISLALARTFRELGDSGRADAVMNEIRSRFPESESLSSYLAAEETGARMIGDYLDDYRHVLNNDPGNMLLRDELIQALFWNGRHEEAIFRTHEGIAVRVYQYFAEYDQANAGLVRLKDSLAMDYIILASVRTEAERHSDTISGLRNAALSALKKKEARDDILAAARDRGEVPPPITGEDPYEAYATAVAALENAEAAANKYLLRLSEVVDRASGYEQMTENILENEDQLNESFLRATAASGWTWDTSFWQKDLSSIGTAVALRALLRVQFVQDDTGLDRGLLYEDALREEHGNPEDAYLRFLVEAGSAINPGKKDNQTGSHTFADIADSAEDAAGYLPHLDDLSGQLNAWLRITETDTGIAERSDADIDTGLERMAAEAQRLLRDIVRLRTSVSEMYRNGIRRTFYSLEVETAPLRHMLGEFYFSVDEMEKATRNLLMVLAVDPWNMSALYTLGNVRQIYGDWHQAMGYYRRVYEMDPGFDAAVRFHNELARANPDVLNSRGDAIFDTSRLNLQAVAEWSHPVNSRYSFSFLLSADHLSIYRYLNGIAPDSGTLYGMRLSIPVRFFRSDFYVTPMAGIQGSSDFDYWNNSAVTRETVPFDLFLDSLELQFLYGLNMGWQIPEASVRLVFESGRKRESFLSGGGRKTIPAKMIEADARASLAMFVPGQELSYARTYARLEYLDDPHLGKANLLMTGALDLVYGFHASDNPWWNIQLLLTTVYENSTSPSRPYYYAPDSSLTAKAGPLSACWFSSGSDRSLGLIARVQGGIYSKYLFGSGAIYAPQAEAEIKLEYGKSGSTAWLRVFGSSTFSDNSDLKYWSAGISAGTGFRAFSLITP